MLLLLLLHVLLTTLLGVLLFHESELLLGLIYQIRNVLLLLRLWFRLRWHKRLRWSIGRWWLGYGSRNVGRWG